MNTVYWGALTKDINIIHNIKPVCIREKYKNVKLHKSQNFNLCPSYYKEANKIYNILAPFDYNITLTSNQVYSKEYNQEIFDKTILVQDMDLKLIQFNLEYVFFTEKNCYMSLGPPYFANSDMAKKVQYIPGGFNINNWFRPVNVGFIGNPDINNIQINRNDPILSVRFDFSNDLPIELKKFYVSPELSNINHILLKERIFFTKNINKYFDELYTKFNNSKIKNTILKEIKNNLMD